MIGIYKIENLTNHKIYIGQSIHIERRFLEHCRQSGKSLISKAIQKYGKDNFTFQILQECSVEDLDNLEEFYIKQYNCIAPNGYNQVLPDKQNKHVFTKYSYEEFLDIVNDIKFSNLSFKEIAQKYKLDLSMIYYINRGDYHTIADEKYPLRFVKDFSKKEWVCQDCGKPISKGSLRCKDCANIAQKNPNKPSREDLKNLIRTHSFVEIGKLYSVSDKTISKWCKTYNLPSLRRDIKKYTDDQWKNI